MNIADYNGVWVFAEQREGQLQKVSLELLGEGRKIADKLGVKLTALLLGNNIENLGYCFCIFSLFECSILTEMCSFCNKSKVNR